MGELHNMHDNASTMQRGEVPQHSRRCEQHHSLAGVGQHSQQNHGIPRCWRTRAPRLLTPLTTKSYQNQQLANYPGSLIALAPLHRPLHTYP